MRTNVGDYVRLKPLKVLRPTVDGEYVYIEMQGRDWVVSLPISLVESVEPRSLQVGDKVEWVEYGGIKHTGVVRAIEGGTLAVWVGNEFINVPVAAADRINDK